MDTGHIKGGGADAIGRNPDLHGRVEKSGSEARASGPAGDSAAISQGGRETLAAVEAMVERLKSGHAARHEHVAAVRGMLENGDLDQPEVFLETARQMLMEQA